MSSDAYFEDESLNGIDLEQLDAIEAGILKTEAEVSVKHSSAPLASQDDSFYDSTFDLDETELQKLDILIEDAYRGKPQHAPGPSKNKSSKQTTLLGKVLPPAPQRLVSASQNPRALSRVPSTCSARQDKKWDQTNFSKSGLRQMKKGKEVENNCNNEQNIPPPFIPLGPTPPMKLSADLLEAKHWIYPLNRPKRDYQYNIARRCLFDNTLVSLPTGLGKTFVAGVVMLNYYRWYPEGKVVFVAPTKPLVSQQIEACHKICGIPGNDAIELTGQVHRVLRAQAWKEKRVFYMTPQTLINDLLHDICDPRDLILLVIDEAHKATGDYAYNQIVRFLMAKNPFHRILSLTATPASDPRAVQRLVDGLHISHIEIRDENSLDLRQYIFHKNIKQHVVRMTEEINKIKDLLALAIKTQLTPLQQVGLFPREVNPAKIHPFAAMDRMKRVDNNNKKWAYGALSRLQMLARGMGYLLEGTMGMCYNYLQEIVKSDDSDAGQAAGATKKRNKLQQNTHFKRALDELGLYRDRGFPMHPKMDLLKTLLVQHFGQNLRDAQDAKNSNSKDTKAMVFVESREVVDEIVKVLDSEQPLIRAHKFIGQGTDKRGAKGLAQREQIEVIKRLKCGEFNVLVATSIGEEGLDIGEVDIIVCYDAQKTPIRMLQRLGRTGRQRHGYAHVLLAEEREELNLEKAKTAYKEVQKTIVRDQLELFTDVPRLLPDHIKPKCLEKIMDIEEYVVVERKPKKNEGKQSRTRKRNNDVTEGIPDGITTCFTTAARVHKKARQSKPPRHQQRDFDLAGEDDDIDLDIESGLLINPCHTKSVFLASKQVEFPGLRSSSQGKISSRSEDENAKDEGDTSESTPSPKQVSPCLSPDDDVDHGLDYASEGGCPRQDGNQNMAWLVADDDEPELELQVVRPSTPLSRKQTSVADESVTFISAKTFLRKLSPKQALTDIDQSHEILEISSPFDANIKKPCKNELRSALCHGMLPIDLQSSPLKQDGSLLASSPFLAIQKRRRRIDDNDSSATDISSPPRKRLHRRYCQSKSPHNHTKSTRFTINSLVDMDAIHSGDEVSEGTSESCDDVHKSDQDFLQELPETQVSPSYNQTLIYQQSLFSQPPVRQGLPSFVNGPVKRTAFQTKQIKHRQATLPTSSLPESEDYEIGSFIVDDDEEISLKSDD